ncbi:porin family protein [Ferruginibacter sp. HRS2-29]|uniref:porin family protein n=1 Tax=Ferruginibacter sp. HRS2-29 TaxID=2487334 RepID=UPI0020CE5E09|nr:porin family protein [Ferruginibacter sp. HRS2-29]MCP9749358.1 porin family protein [Ferruginibacter sp. HRS2-29]
MKKVLMSALIVASFFGAKAQSGTVLVGGDVDFSSNKVENSDVKSHSISFNPYVGYQFNDNWTAGITAALNSSKNENGINDSKNNSFAAGPFIRYTKPLSNIFAVYGQLQGVYGGYKSKLTSGNVTTTTAEGNTLGVNLFPAVFINLKNSFGLNFNVGGISYNNNDPKSGPGNNSFNINFGKTVSIGLSKNFGGKKKA